MFVIYDVMSFFMYLVVSLIGLSLSPYLFISVVYIYSVRYLFLYAVRVFFMYFCVSFFLPFVRPSCIYVWVSLFSYVCVISLCLYFFI